MMRLFVSVLVIGLGSWTVADDEWPQFRGPGGQGHSDAKGLPVRWSETENIAWKAALPGEGHSSPVISGNQIWVTTAITRELTPDEEKERLAKLKNPQGLKLAGELTLQAIQIDRESGQVARTVDLFKVPNPEPKHALNSYASPTPVIAAKRMSIARRCLRRSRRSSNRAGSRRIGAPSANRARKCSSIRYR